MNPDDILNVVKEISDSMRIAAKKNSVVFITDFPEEMSKTLDIGVQIEKDSFGRLLENLLGEIIDKAYEGFVKLTLKSYMVYRNASFTRDLMLTMEVAALKCEVVDLADYTSLCEKLKVVLSVSHDVVKGCTYRLTFTNVSKSISIKDRRAEKGAGFDGTISEYSAEGVIDVERLRKKLGISGESIYSILKAFYKSMPSRIREATVFAETDIEKYRIAIHGFKGALSNIGVEDLRRMAILLERAAYNKDVAYIREYNPFFISEINEFCKKLKAFLKSYVISDETKTASSIASKNVYYPEICNKADKELSYKAGGEDVVLKEMLNDVIEYIKHLENLEAIDVLNNILKKKICKEPEKIIKIISALDIYDYSNAMDTVMEMTKG